MLHCGKFKASDIWFLDDTSDYEQRELRLGVCPQCQKQVGELVQTRKFDGHRVCERATRRKLQRMIEQEKLNITYTSQQCNELLKVRSGWSFGVNKEFSTKSGNTINRQYARDFYGTTELVKQVVTKNG